MSVEWQVYIVREHDECRSPEIVIWCGGWFGARRCGICRKEGMVSESEDSVSIYGCE